MIKFFSAVICFAAIVFHCNAQNEIPKAKKFNHYAGIQANELLRQLFNFSNTNTTINNPYTIIYSLIPANSGWGYHIGLGYKYSWINDKNAAVGKVSKVNDLFYRIGIEKKITLGKRFEVGVALDFAGSYQQDKTSSLSVTNLFNSVDSSATTVTDKIISYGGGPQASLGFHITDKIMLGTEATLYYKSQKNKQNILIIDTVTEIFNNNNKVINTSNFNTEIDSNTLSISIPLSLFLIVKF